MRHLHRMAGLAAGLLLLLGATGARRTSIVATPHNLSVSGRGAIRSTTESEICIFDLATQACQRSFLTAK